MIDDINDIAAYYNREFEREQTRLDRHQLEHDLTWRFLNQYLPLVGNILEIGAATGSYTLELAKKGYALTSVDISKTSIEKCKKSLVHENLDNRVKLVVADARDLHDVTEKEFDAVLLMGPLYHLVHLADRKLALKEAYDRLRKGGVIFSAFISRFGIMGDLIKNVPDWIEDQDEVRSVLEIGRDPDHFPGEGFRGYFANVSEIAPLHEEIGFETVTEAAVEPAISSDDESYNKLEGKQRELWLDLFYKMSTEKSIIGASRHILYVGIKR
jgi:S-adenosylmethionine-dependent methyltransferase